MPVKEVDKKAKKAKYFEKLAKLLDAYPKIMLVTCSNVGSNHMQKIRTAIRKEGELLMGKNTLIRKVIREHLQKNPELEPLIPHVKGNIGFVFTAADIGALRTKLQSIKVEAPAKAGAIAPNDVVIPAGNTGLEPTQTSFLQALNIASKINKGQVEIISDVHLVKKGEKVGQSESALLSKLNLKPFIYGLSIKAVYEAGFVATEKIIDLMGDADTMLEKLRKGIQAMAAVSLALNYPTLAAVPHILSRGFQNLIGLTLTTPYNFAQAEKLKNAASSAPAPAPVKTPGGDKPGKPAEKEPEEKPVEKEPEEEVDLGGGFDLFA